jgi:hypothetical protein
MSRSRHQLLDDALDLSRRMAELGESGEWESVIELEAHRRQLLEQAFATHLPADEVVADRVKHILEYDKQLMSHSLDARERVAAELAASNKGRKAANAYHSAGR